MSVNRRYFDSLMQARDLSLRALAKRMGLSHSQLSLAFNGHRRLQINEAAELARIFGEPLARVVEAAGITVPNTGASRVSVIGALQGDGTIAMHPEGVIERTDAPDGVPEGGVAVQARTSGSPLDWLDGAVFFCARPNGVDSAILGRLAMCKIENGPSVIASVRRGYLPHTLNLRGPYSADSVRLISATPVLFSRH